MFSDFAFSTLFVTYLLTGLTVGFGHCIGMCGPLVVSFSFTLRGQSVLIPHLLYHAGRTLTYMVLGGIMGATGTFAIVAANIAVIQKGAMFLAGALIVAMGLAMTGWLPMGAIFGLNYAPTGWITDGFRRLTRGGSRAAYLPIGMILGLLPCGPVYTALIGAARAGMEAPSIGGGIATGMLMMFAFGVGTMPALFLIGKLANMGWTKYRDHIYKGGALLMIAVGIYFLFTAASY